MKPNGTSHVVPISDHYIKMLNWFWEEVPYIDGFKASHATLFLAIIDAINRNFWRQNTAIAYDRIINKCKFSKQVYLDGREWLIEKQLIEMTAGRNAYQMATFNLGVAVRNQTGNLTGNLTGIKTGNATPARPVTLPINNTDKQINNKTENTLEGNPSKVVNKESKKFIVPEENDVFNYMKEKQDLNWNDTETRFQTTKFIDYYTSNGWKVGKNKMSDWKATVRTWITNYKNFNHNGTYKSGFKSQPAIQPAKVDCSENWGR